MIGIGLVVLQELAHWGALAPLFACAWSERIRGVRLPESVWLVAAALGVSFVADHIGLLLALGGINNHWLSFVVAPIQYGLVLGVLIARPGWRWLVLTVFWVMGLGSLLRGPLTRPEVLVELTGGVLMAVLVWRAVQWTALRPGLMVYGLATAPGLLGMALFEPRDPRWLIPWSLYQGARVAGLALLTVALMRHERRKEVTADGSGTGSVTNRRRHGDWGGDRRAGPAVPARAQHH